MRSLIPAAFLILLACATAAGQEEEVDPIDTALTKCLDVPANQGTQGMVECFGSAYESWDKALNAAYAEAMESLDTSQQDLLKASQRRWIAYRDAEDDFLTSMVTPEAGSIRRITTSQAMTELVKARVLALRAYFEE